ncbi:unknown [Clostridium sp. CAG:1024]|nr:unknown [Clostridium sp. CAG:1024]
MCIPHVDEHRGADALFLRDEQQRFGKRRADAHGNLDGQRFQDLGDRIQKALLHIHVRDLGRQLTRAFALRCFRRGIAVHGVGNGRAVHEHVLRRARLCKRKRDQLVDVVRLDALLARVEPDRRSCHDELGKGRRNGHDNIADTDTRHFLRIANGGDDGLVERLDVEKFAAFIACVGANARTVNHSTPTNGGTATQTDDFRTSDIQYRRRSQYRHFLQTTNATYTSLLYHRKTFWRKGSAMFCIISYYMPNSGDSAAIYTYFREKK